MEWTLNDKQAIYVQLVEHMQRAVVKEEFKAGEKVPGVRELASQAGVNPNTMQRALMALEESGLLKSQRTSGRFVTEDVQEISKLRQNLASQLMKDFLQNISELGLTNEECKNIIKQMGDELK